MRMTDFENGKIYVNCETKLQSYLFLKHCRIYGIDTPDEFAHPKKWAFRCDKGKFRYASVPYYKSKADPKLDGEVVKFKDSFNELIEVYKKENEQKYSIEEVIQMIMDAEILIPVEKLSDKKGNSITKKQYGIILLKELCKELKVKHKKLTKEKKNADA